MVIGGGSIERTRRKFFKKTEGEFSFSTLFNLIQEEQKLPKAQWPPNPFLGIRFNEAISLTDEQLSKFPSAILKRYQFCPPDMLNEQFRNATPNGIEEWWTQQTDEGKYPYRWKAVLAALFKKIGLKATKTAVLKHCKGNDPCYSLAIEARIQQEPIPYYFSIQIYQSTSLTGRRFYVRIPAMYEIAAAESHPHFDDPKSEPTLISIPRPLAVHLFRSEILKQRFKGEQDRFGQIRKSPRWPGQYIVPEPIFLQALKEAVESP